MIPNRCVLQQHVDCKITDTLLKRGTKQHEDGWDSSRKDWSHMCIHLPHEEGGFGVTFNEVTKDTVFYSTTCTPSRHPFQPDYTVRLQGGLCAVSIIG
jgi:hypothetical protein